MNNKVTEIAIQEAPPNFWIYKRYQLEDGEKHDAALDCPNVKNCQLSQVIKILYNFYMNTEYHGYFDYAVEIRGQEKRYYTIEFKHDNAH
jgi:hypothetical protein